MKYAIYKCKACGQLIMRGLTENQLEETFLDVSENPLKTKSLHHCTENPIGIAKLCGFEEK